MARGFALLLEDGTALLLEDGTALLMEEPEAAEGLVKAQVGFTVSVVGHKEVAGQCKAQAGFPVKVTGQKGALGQIKAPAGFNAKALGSSAVSPTMPAMQIGFAAMAFTPGSKTTNGSLNVPFGIYVKVTGTKQAGAPVVVPVGIRPSINAGKKFSPVSSRLQIGLVSGSEVEPRSIDVVEAGMTGGLMSGSLAGVPDEFVTIGNLTAAGMGSGLTTPEGPRNANTFGTLSIGALTAGTTGFPEHHNSSGMLSTGAMVHARRQLTPIRIDAELLDVPQAELLAHRRTGQLVP
jgi:hypothetical protein